MLGLLGVGIALTFGLAVKSGSYAGAVMMLLMWLSVLPPEHHPFLDEHIVYALVLVALANAKTHRWSFHKQYSTTKLAKILS